MPGYWGIGAWTGASRFSHATVALYETTSSSPSLDVFASDNEAGGRNVVVVNRSTREVLTTRLRLLGRPTTGSYVAWVTDPARPYDPPTPTVSQPYLSSVTLSLKPLSATTIVLDPTTGGS